MPRKPTNIPAQQRTTYGTSHAVRLSDHPYAGPDAIHLTICAHAGKPFTNDALAHAICNAVERACELKGYNLYGYCLMPNHLHVLLSSGDSDIPIETWLQSFKGFTTNWHAKHGGTAPLWQRSAFDHVCRRNETVQTVLAYILENPVRADLVENAADWRWSKSFVDL